MANNSLYNSSLANLYRSIGLKRGISPAFINASIAQGIAESSLNPNAIGDNGQARGLHQWHGPRQAGVDFNSPESQINHWYDENKANWGITDPVKANAAAIGSERPAGWKPGDPTGVPSYNKRLGDTLALMRFQGYQQDPQDPKSFMALGSDSMPAANTEQPQGAQSISLGSEEQQPFNNIGSTLANVGASIASLDNRGTGIASLNASRVASNLQQQEALRERENGWKYAGQTDNGQGLIFQRPDGQTRIEPIAPQFAGSKSNDTSLQKDYAWAAGDADKMKLVEASHGIKDKTPVSPDTIRTLGEQVLAGNYKALTRLGEDNRVAVWDYIGKKEKDLGLPAGYILQSEAEQEARKTAEREYGRMDARRNTAGNTFLAGASTLIDLSEQMPRNHYYTVNEILNFSKKQMQDPQLSKLNAAVNTAVNEYANAITTSASGATVSDKQHARELLSSAQDHESLKGALQTMTQEVVRSKENIFMSNENRRAKAKGQEVPYPQLEGSGPGGSGVPKALEEKLAPKSTIRDSAKAPTNISSPNDLMNWIQSSGLKKGDKFTLPDGTEGTVP